jgi:uncharacterized protein YndB with AHSA1/START domain
MTMGEASFSYVTYIHATVEEVWDGLTDPDLTSRYWFHDNVSDWTAGSDWAHRRSDDPHTVDIAGTVLESDPPNRLVVSWARPDDVGDPSRTSRVTIEISPQDEWPLGPWTGLRLEHSELEGDREMLDSVSFGWPAVLSGLKSILERPDIFELE